MRRKMLIAGWLCLFLVVSSAGLAKVMPVEFDVGRNRLLAFMLSHQLPSQHFDHKPFDDTLSLAAYKLYLRQLDPRKRFLLQGDVDQLSAFADHIDEELSRGRIVLPDAGMQILDERVKEVRKQVDEIFAQGFQPERKEYLETDPKKIDYAADLSARRERWSRSLKYDVLETYLSSLEKKNKKSGLKKQLQNDQPIDRQLWDEALEKVRKRTHIFLHRLLQVTRQEHYNRYFDAIARAFDPHTNYMPPTSKEDFDIHMSGSLEGIGALLREDDGSIKVVRIIPGSAAAHQGQLHAEDTILAVSEKDGEPVDISDMRIREAVSYIRGPKGTEVRLTVLRPDGVRKVIPIVRDVVKIEETYVKSTVLHDGHGAAIGYIKIPSFYRDFSGGSKGRRPKSVTDDTRHELHALKKQGIKGLILDLRNNGGGSLSDAVDVSGLFLPGGPVVQVKNYRGNLRVLYDEDLNVVFDGPMIVLVNQFSASASEILAAALQDYRRALIVGGAHTHGKGTVQALVDLNRNLPLLHLRKYADLGALKVTIQKFYRINGGSTQYRGVVPDVVLPSMLDYLKTGEKYIDNSLPWDQVSGATDWSEWTGSRFDVPLSVKKSQQYVRNSKQFSVIAQESLKAKKRSEETKVSDFLTGLVREREELEKERQEAKEAGIMKNELDQQGAEKKEKKSLGQRLADDPYVQLTLFLMDDDQLILH